MAKSSSNNNISNEMTSITRKNSHLNAKTGSASKQHSNNNNNNKIKIAHRTRSKCPIGK